MKRSLLLLALFSMITLNGCYKDNSSQAHKTDIYKIYTLNTEMFLLNISTGHTWELDYTKNKSAYWKPIYFSATSKVSDPAKALELNKTARDILLKSGFTEDKHNLTSPSSSTNK